MNRYVNLIDHCGSGVVERTALDEQAARSESIFLGLRLMRGVELDAHRLRFGTDLQAEHRDALAQLSAAGLIELDKELLRLTTRGALLSNEVFAALA
jgi:oxygen-independent coproporphyrinogen-3 oxidase